MARPRKQQTPAAKKTPESLLAPCTPGNCNKDHIFELRSISAASLAKLDCKLEFCPQLNSVTKKLERVVPRLNRDGKYYTPCFILQAEEAHYQQNDEKYKLTHDMKLKEYLQSRQEIYQPKHGRKSKVCAVCRIQYNEYRDHIRSDQHKQKVRASPYNSHILDLCSLVNTQASQSQETPAHKQDWEKMSVSGETTLTGTGSYSQNNLNNTISTMLTRPKKSACKASKIEQKYAELKQLQEQQEQMRRQENQFRVEDYLL